MSEMVAKIDDLGQPAWIALMVLGFVVFWPVGLAILAYLLWSGRMGCSKGGYRGRWKRRMTEKWEQRCDTWSAKGQMYSSSGNSAFDEYRDETLRRLEEEQREFKEFLVRLRMAKDRVEFDQFMTEQRVKPEGGPDNNGSTENGTVPQVPTQN